MIDYSTCKKNRYIYAWYYTNTNEIFYIGKGTGGRWKDTVGSRNNLFKSIINKHLSKGEVAVKKLYENLTEEESLSLERKLIREYWDKGLCKANFHEGGCGGYTGNYDNPERSRKISEAMKKSWKDPNSKLYGPNKGKKLSKEWCIKIGLGNKGKKVTDIQKQHMLEANIKSHNTKEYHDKMSKIMHDIMIEKSKDPNWILKNRTGQSKHHYFVKWDDKLIYDTYFRPDLVKFLETTEYIHISRTIIFRILKGTYIPKFNKHIELMKHLKILIFDKSVSTIPDECKGVESEISTDSKCVTSN